MAPKLAVLVHLEAVLGQRRAGEKVGQVADAPAVKGQDVVAHVDEVRHVAWQTSRTDMASKTRQKGGRGKA